MRRRWLLLLTSAWLPVLSSCAHQPAAAELYQEGWRAFAAHDYQSAESKLQQAIDQSPDGKEKNKQLCDTWLLLARVFSEEGKYQSAEDALGTAVNCLSQTYGAQSEPVATALLKLSACHHKQGEYAAAAPVCEKALSIEEKLSPPPDLLLAATANNLAETYERLNNEEKAEQLFKRSLSYYRRHQDSEEGKRGLLETLDNLALFYKQTNRMKEAEATVKSAMALAAGRTPFAASARAAALSTLATIERGAFDQQGAALSYQGALALLKQAHSADDQLLAEISGNYASMLCEQEDYDAAEKFFKQAIDYGSKAHGQMHPSVARRLKELSALYKEEGRFGDAEALLKRALQIDKIAFQSDSPITMDTMNSLSAVLVAQGKCRQAEDVYADWMPTLVKVLGPEHPHVADALENWALVADKARDGDLASKLRARAKRIRIQAERPS